MGIDNEIELIKTNYATLHDSVQSAHRISWTITGIFVPVAFASIALVSKESMHLLLKLTILTGSFLLIWFWKKLLEFLDQLNDIRVEKLKSIEDYINQNLSEEKGYDFSYYNFLKKKLDKRSNRIRFNDIVGTFFTLYRYFIFAAMVIIIIIELVD